MESTCKRCGKTSTRDFGEVRYGIKNDKESKKIYSQGYELKTTKDTYRVLGEEKHFICNNCINYASKKSKIINAIIFFVSLGLILSLQFFTWSGEGISDFLLNIVVYIVNPLLVITLIWSFIILLKKLLWRDFRKKITDQLAINLRKREEFGEKMVTSNYWDRFEFKKLKESEKVRKLKEL